MRKVLLTCVAGLVLVGAGVAAAPTDSKPSRNETRSVSIAVADDGITVPAQDIVAPTKPVALGKNVVFGVSPLSDPKPKGLVSVTHTWVISPKVDDLFTWPDNTKGAFGAGLTPTTYNLTRVSTYSYVDDSGKYLATRTVEQDREVTVGGGLPKPPTPVDPVTPTPVVPTPVVPTPAPLPVLPVLPALDFNLAPFIYNLAKTMSPAEATKLAGVFKATSSKIAAGGITTKAGFVTEIASSTNAVLGESLKNWATILDALAVEWNTTLKAKLLTPVDFGKACDEVALGLAAIK